MVCAVQLHRHTGMTCTLLLHCPIIAEIRTVGSQSDYFENFVIVMIKIENRIWIRDDRSWRCGILLKKEQEAGSDTVKFRK